MLQGLVVRQNGKSAAIEELVEVFYPKTWLSLPSPVAHNSSLLEPGFCFRFLCSICKGMGQDCP